MSLTEFSGLSREQELENILGDILDLYNLDYIIYNPTGDDEEEADVDEVMDRAAKILDRDGDEIEF